MPIKNSCVPQSIYGSFAHTMFLGSSVRSFDVSGGWNQETSELVVELVDDPCPGTKIYYDTSLYQQTWTAADPGFFGSAYPIIGCPVYFRVANFEYCGIIQSWEELDSINGNPTYRIRIVSPTQILEGAKLIINDYGGSVGDIFNTFNCYGWAEVFGNPCPQTYLKTLTTSEKPDPDKYLGGDAGVDGAQFGTESGGFGGSLVNPNGMQWNRIKTTLNILTGAIPAVSNAYSPYGRLMFYGSNYSGFGLCTYDRIDTNAFAGHSGYLSEYILDLSELPNPGDYFRLSGNNISILDAINQVCDICSYDYYIELLLIRNVITNIAPSTIAKIIKVRAVSRATQPAFGSIQTFIGDSGGTIATSVGRELRNETTSSFLIGGNKQTIYQIEQNEDPEDDGDLDDYPAEADDIILPYFGLDIDDDVLLPQKDSAGKWYFYAPLDGINDKLKVIKYLASPGDPNRDYDSIKITETELQCALAGYDQWLSYIMSVDLAGNIITEIGKSIDATGVVPGLAGCFDNRKIMVVMQQLQALPPNQWQMRAAEFIKTLGPWVNADKLVDKAKLDDLQAIYDWVYSYANTFYGTYFQVRIPYTCIKLDTSSGHIVTSEEGSDGGWTEQAEVIQLTNGWFTDKYGVSRNYIQKFQLEDGRLGCFVRYDYNFTTDMKYGLADLDQDSYQLLNTSGDEYSLWLKAETEKDFVYLDKDTYFSPRAIIKVATPIRKELSDALESQLFLFILLKKLAEADPALLPVLQDQLKQMFKKPGAHIAEIPLLYDYVMPDAAAIPIKSNSNTYGPWVSLGPAGTVRVDQDPGLVPWEYGGMTNLNLAANELVTNGLSLSQIEEMGDVAVPGYPEVPLSAEIGAVAGGYYAGGENLIENRLASTGSFSENDYTSTPISFSYCYFPYLGGAWVGTYGPHITNINVQVGTEGVQTRYQFRTFTKKFGNMQKMNAERIKEVGKVRLEAERNLRSNIDNKEKRLKFYSGRGVSLERIKRDRKGVVEHHNTPSEVLVGQVLNWDNYGSGCKRTAVVLEKMTDLPSEMINEYPEKAFMSLDGLIRPISMDGDGGLPQYPTVISSCQKTHSIGSQSPIYYSGNLEYDLQIDINYLNPFSNPSGYSRSSLSSRCSSTGYNGHDIEILGRGDSGDIENTLVMPIEGIDHSGTSGNSDYYNDYRAMALRGPLLLNGWGYDLDGFPIPNAADTTGNASVGIFTSSNLQTKFLDNWLKKPETWVTAPVDLRFDRARGVWVSPPEFRLITATLSGNLAAGGSQWAILTSTPSKGLWNESGNAIINPLVVVTDKVGCNPLPSGSPVIAYYHPEKCEYWILNSCYTWEPPSDSSSDSSSISDSISDSISSSISDSVPSSISSSISDSLSNSISESISSSLSESISDSLSQSDSIQSQSDKSTAIVPASWSPSGYTALFIAEMPEVRFDDVIILTVTEKNSVFAVDPKFLDVCEPNTIEVCGATSDEPVTVGVSIQNEMIKVKLSRKRKNPVRLVVRLTGIRKGFLNKRFPDRTREQFIANEKFIKKAYPGSSK